MMNQFWTAYVGCIFRWYMNSIGAFCTPCKNDLEFCDDCVAYMGFNS